MYDANFRPAGAAFAAIVAGLAPGAQLMAPVEAQQAAETTARETLRDVAARMTPSAPFAPGQLELPFE